MTQGIEFIEGIYEQLHEAEIIRSKGEFSERLLGKSPSYLTSMRAKQRTVSTEVVMSLGDAIQIEVNELDASGGDAKIRARLRRVMAQINLYLADQTVPHSVLPSPVPKVVAKNYSTGVIGWFRALRDVLAR